MSILKSSTKGKSQTISITDIISEGPIQGLVAGGASIFLDDTSIIPEDRAVLNSYTGSTTSQVSFTNSSTSVSLPDSTNLGASAGTERLAFIRNVDLFDVTDISYPELIGNNFVGADTALVLRLSDNGIDPSDSKYFGGSSLGGTKETARLKRGGSSFLGYLEPKLGSFLGEVYFIPLESTPQMVRLIKRELDVLFEDTSTTTLEVDYIGEVTSLNDTPQLKNNFPFPTGSYTVDFSSPYRIGENVFFEGGDIKNSSNISNTSYEFRVGTAYQEPITFTPGGNATTSISSSINRNLTLNDSKSENPTDPDNPVVTITTGDLGLTSGQIEEVDELRVSFQYSSLIANKVDGTELEAGAVYKIQVITYRGGDRNSGQASTFTPTNGRTHRGKNKTAVSFQELISLEQLRPFQDFDIKITRLTRHDGVRITGSGEDAPKDAQKMSAACSITNVTSIIKERLSYPFTSHANVTFSSVQYSNLPTRSYDIFGKKVKIPKNYTPRELSGNNNGENNNTNAWHPDNLYTGFWTGDFKDELVYTDNPAWVFYDIITNERYGLGSWINQGDIDKYALYRIARYCDELVPDGKGGLEPRFRANIYLTKQTDAYKVLKDFATIFLGMLYWMDGKITAIHDHEKEPIFTFSNSNVLQGEFSYENTGSKTRPNQIVVSWNNPEADYALEPLIVEDRDNIIKTGKLLTQKAVAFGCTSEGQAYRYGLWKLWTAKNQTEVLSFSTSIDATFLSPGDVINVQDANRYNVGMSGRIVSVPDSTTFVMDRQLAFDSNNTYELAVLLTDSRTESQTNLSEDDIGETLVEKKDLVNVTTGFTNTIEVASAFSSDPDTNTVFVIKELQNGLESDGTAKEYRILSISESSKNAYDIVAVEYYDEKYDAIEKNYTLAIKETVFPTITKATPSYAPLNLYVGTNSDPVKKGDEFTIFWDAPTAEYYGVNESDITISGYEIEHNIPEYPNPIEVKSDVLSYKFTGVGDGSYFIGVRSRNLLNVPSKFASAIANVEDSFKLNVARKSEGLGVGGIVGAPLKITAGVLGFVNGTSNTTTPGISTVVNPTDVIINSINTVDLNSLEDGVYEILFDKSTLSLVPLLHRSTQNLGYWYKPGVEKVSISGSINITANSNIITATGSSFNQDFVVGDVIYFTASDKYAKITNIISETKLIIDRSFSTDATTSIQKVGYSIDFTEDSLICKVEKVSDVFTLSSYMSLDSTILPRQFKLVAVYKKEATVTTPEGGSYASPIPSGWSSAPLSLENDGDIVYVSTRTFTSDGEEQDSTWSTPVIYSQKTDGTNATPLTITGSETVDGVTTITFSDTSKIEINDGSNGTSQGVIVLYAPVAEPTLDQISLTLGSNEYVYYYEWLNTYPDINDDGIPDDAADNTFVKFIGENGTTTGILPIYSSVADPTEDSQLSLTAGSNEYITFYEYTGDVITTVPEDSHTLTFVKFVGESVTITGSETVDGVTTITFSSGDPITINDGTNGTSQGVIVLYAPVADPILDQISLTLGSNEYVYYYEWLNTYPDTNADGIPDDAADNTFVKFIGEPGATGRVTPIYSSVADPTEDSQLSLTAGSNEYVTFYEYTGDVITAVPTDAHEFTYVRFVGESITGNTGFLYYESGDTSTDSAHITLTNVTEGQVAIVTNTSGDQAGYVYSGTEWVAKDIVNSGIIFADAIGAGQLEISADAANTANSIFFDGTNNSIKIYSDDGNGTAVLRVRLGNLVD